MIPLRRCVSVPLPTRRRAWVQLTWFWALSASLQALLMPDPGRGQDFPSVFYFTYFGYHIGAIVAAPMLVGAASVRAQVPSGGRSVGRWAGLFWRVPQIS